MVFCRDEYKKGADTGGIHSLKELFLIFFPWLQWLDAVVYICRRMWILSGEFFNQTLAYGAAVLVIGLRKHNDQLGNAASGNNIALTQIMNNQLL